MGDRRISIQDVADQAGVSITSVSRIINKVDYPISAEIRRRVEQAVQDLNYSPNLAAQRLRSSFNNVIGIIARDIANSFFAEIAKGATERAMSHGYLCFVCNTGRVAASELEFHELLWKNRVQGIILTGGGLDSPEYRDMLQRQLERSRRFGLRLVACAPQGVDTPLVSIDFRAMARLITGHLAGRGHRRIAFITGRPDVITSHEHQHGYRAELAARGLPFDPALFVCGDFTEQAGYELCRGLLDRKAGMSAICCGSDAEAIGVIHALTERGLAVPDDVSIASIGDMPMAAYTLPPLTTVRVPRYEIGAQAIETILARGEAPANRIFPVELIERQSVRKLN
jgi:LacI family transcriptional regulator